MFLIFICFLCFGNYYVYDNPAALQAQFQDVCIVCVYVCIYVCMNVCIHHRHRQHHQLTLNAGHEDQHSSVYADVCTLLVAQCRSLLLRGILYGPRARRPVSQCVSDGVIIVVFMHVCMGAMVV